MNQTTFEFQFHALGDAKSFPPLYDSEKKSEVNCELLLKHSRCSSCDLQAPRPSGQTNLIIMRFIK